MNKENNFSKIKDENGVEWEVCDNNDNNDEYEYKEIEVYDLKTHDYTFDALNKLMANDIKTNIHFIYSKITHNLAIELISGIDIWNGKLNIEKLNAVIFLLFKPHGAGKYLDWRPTEYQIKELSKHIFNPKSEFKIGMDSCLVNHVINYGTPTELQAMSIDTCEASRMSAYITPTMKFMPCSFATESEFSVQIDYKNGMTLKKIWDESEPFKKFRKVLENKKDCCPLGL